MKAYYGAKISPHMMRTPEGFLICHDVPICRTGTQEYLPMELGLAGENPIEVLREESEVFKPNAMASFEGKPVTDDHPPMGVDSSNYASYAKGTAKNVHRGTGKDNDKLLCDLVIYDAALIAKIDAGKREVSCGYECVYEETDSGYRQTNIVGNHVAIVEEGRAGHEVAIRDVKPERGRTMPRRGSILQRMFAAFSKDAEPEEIREAARAVDEAEENGQGQAQEKETMHDKDYEAIMDAINALNAKVNALSEQKQKAKDEEENGDVEMRPIEDAEEALENPQGRDVPNDDPNASTFEDEDPQGEAVTRPPEEIGRDEAPDAERIAPSPTQAADRKAILSVVRAVKPFIATMPDGKRKRAADALSKAVKRAMGIRNTQPLAGGYGALIRRQAADSLAKQMDARAFGENCRKRNPHYHKEGK